MISLVLGHKASVQVESQQIPDLSFSSVDFEPSSNSIVTSFGPSEFGSAVEIQLLGKTGTKENLAFWELTSETDVVVSSKYFIDTETVVIVLKSGDLYIISEGAVELVGSLEEVHCACWSPDDEILAIATASSFYLFSKSLDLIQERPLSPQDLQVSAHVSVGWGKKETQFQGRGARALRDPTVPEKVDSGVLSADENKLISQISWRGDGEFVALMSIDELDSLDPSRKRRTIRVYSRDGTLDSVSEPCDELSNVVSWRPSGALIAAYQHSTHSIVFFERNGLRRGEFKVYGEKNSPISLCWSSDSGLLAVVFEHSCQLYYRKNYHWYLKMELKEKNAIEQAVWNPEKPLTLMIKTSAGFSVYDFFWSTISGSTQAPNDDGSVVVMDADKVNVTPLAKANVPPPMYFATYKCESIPLHCALGPSGQIAVLFADKVIVLQRSARDFKCTDIEFDEFPLNPKQIAFYNETPVIVSDNTVTFPHTIFELPLTAFLLTASTQFDSAIVETVDGSIFSVTESGVKLLCKLPERCASVKVTANQVFGLTVEGSLYHYSQLISRAVTSLCTTDALVIFTTHQNVVKLCHVGDKISVPGDDVVNDERCRAIERGSRLVTVMPSSTALTLQAPRGNLETIYPRVMVLGGVRSCLKNVDYKGAFVLCRKHRIDLNILYDFSPISFLNHTTQFIKDLATNENLDLFLSTLKEEDVCETMYKDSEASATAPAEKPPTAQAKGKINEICDAILAELPKSSISAITAFACKSPPDLETALNHCSAQGSPEKIEQAVVHLCFLQDVELLYKTALGIYSIGLTLLVAQQSQKDPKEYLPFLQNLKEQSELRRRFLIDTHLKRYSKAVAHLAEMEEFDELKEFVVEHGEYQTALNIYRYKEQEQNEIYYLYAAYLYEEKKFLEAGIIYESLEHFEQAQDAFVAAVAWKEALSLPCCDRSTAEQLATLTMEAHDYHDSAIIYNDYLQQPGEAIRMYCKGGWFADALRIAKSNPTCNGEDVYSEIIDVGLMELFGTLSELVSDCKSQIKSQVNRLRELRQKKAEDPIAFFGGAEREDVPDNVSIAPSEVSTAPSFLTKYTGKTAGTAKTGASRRSSKNRRREERKRARGKKGSIYEEEYLINSMRRLIERLDQTRPEAYRLLEGLCRRNMKDHAYQIQKSFVEVIAEYREVVSEVFTVSEKDLERYDDDGNLYFVERPAVPSVEPFKKMSILDY